MAEVPEVDGGFSDLKGDSLRSSSKESQQVFQPGDEFRCGNEVLRAVRPSRCSDIEKLSIQVTFEPDEVAGAKIRLSDKALLCLQSLCMDSPSMCWQTFTMLCYMTGFGVLLSLLVLWAYVVFPFQKPEQGFLENWVFNFVAHPVANYIVARGGAEWFARQVLSDLEERSELQKGRREKIRARIKRSVCWVPLVDSLACAAEHSIFAAAKIYPMPFSTVLSCMPGASLSLVVLYLVLPKEVRVLDNTMAFFKFTVSTWAAFCSFYIIMLFYTAMFPSLGIEMQVAMSLLVSAIELVVCSGVLALGWRWNVHRDFMREMRTCMKLPVIIIKAANLSEAKGFSVVLSMMMPEIMQVGRSIILILLDLASSGILDQAVFKQTMRRSRQHFHQQCQGILSEMKLLRQKMKDIGKTCQSLKQEEIQNMTWSEEEILLLNEVSSSLSAVVMLEVCEVMGPAIYMSLLLCLQSNTVLGQNRSFFLGLANAKLEESLILNGLSLLLEAGMLLSTDLFIRALIGLNFVSLIRAILWCDFSFWLSTLSMAYVAWLTMMVEHTGHDFRFQFHWIH